MALIETWLKSDLGSPVQVKYLNGNMFSQDNQANLIGVRVYEDGEPAELTGTVSANVIRADGGTVTVAGTRQNGNECYVILPQAAYAVPGAISVIIKLTSGSQVTTLAAVISTVYTSSTDTVVDPGTILPSIQTLIAAIDAAVASIPADYSDLWASIAPNYSIIGFPVYTGYLCTHDGHLYRAKGDIPTSEAWNSSHWAQVNMGDYLHETKSAFNHSLSVAGENLLSISDFDTPTDSNVTFSVSGGKITITNGSSANYAGLLTSSTFLAKLVKGRMYRFHARCSIDSGDAAPIIAAKSGNNYVNAIYIGVSASTVADFVVDNNTSAIALMVAFGSSTSGSVVSFDELWVKEMGQDAVARADISDVKSAFEYNENCDRAGFIPYACNGSNTNILTVSQNGNEITINGTSNATAGQVTTKILISDHIHSWNSWTTPTADLVYSIPIRKGRKYQIKATVVSGERDAGQGAGYISALLYGNGGVNIAEAIVEINDTESVAIGEASADTKAQVRAYVARLMTVTNLVVRITVEDVTLQEEKQDKLTFDSFPVEGSNNPVKSNGISYEIEELRDAIGTKEDKKSLTADSGYYWNAETSTAVKTAVSTYKAYNAVSVNPGERYKATGLDADSSKQYMVLIVDENYTILTHYGDRSGTTKTYTFSIPDGASYILLTTKSYSTVKLFQITLNEIQADMLPGVYDFNGKNIAIIGDSISTNGNWSADNPLGNVPEIVIQDEDVGIELSAYATYYDIGTTVGGHEIVAADVGTEITFTPVAGDVGKIVGKPKNNNAASVVTWWEVARAALGFNPIAVCWSGSSITDHEENVQEDGGYIYKCAHAWHPSQIRKCGIRTPGTMTRTAPDMVIIYRGTNDLTHSPFSRITDYMDSFPNNYPDSDTSSYGGSTVYDYAKGIRLTIKKLRDAYPGVKIVLCTLNYFLRLYTNAPYTYNSAGDNWIKYNAMIRKVAEHEGCDLIEFDKDGLTWSNAYDGYYQDATNKWTHPTTKGHKVLGNRALRDLMKINNMT